MIQTPQIASMDVENALTSHPHIDEVAAIALPHPILGEVVGAVVTLRESAKARGVKVTEESILGHVRSKLPKHAVPAMVIIWEGGLRECIIQVEDKGNRADDISNSEERER